MTHKLVLSIFTSSISLTVLIIYLSQNPSVFADPISINPPVAHPASPPQHLIAFLPYWNINQALEIPPQLTDIMYFSFTLNGFGEVVSDAGSARFTHILNRIHPGQNLHLVITILNSEDIIQLLSKPKYQKQAISSIVNLVQQHPIQGINIDFEPNTPVDSLTKDQFSQFIHLLHASLGQTNHKIILSLDLYPDPRHHSLWDLNTLEPYLDLIIVMAYDYHRPHSPRAGPIAPMYGQNQGYWSSDVFSNYTSLAQFTPINKLVLGIPLYGYSWHTTSKDYNATTYPNSYRLATHKRTLSLLNQHSYKVSWDPIALSPWVVFEQEGHTRQLYFENIISIGYKLDLINQTKTAGAAFWALGYEDSDNDFWENIHDRLKVKHKAP